MAKHWFSAGKMQGRCGCSFVGFADQSEISDFWKGSSSVKNGKEQQNVVDHSTRSRRGRRLPCGSLGKRTIRQAGIFCTGGWIPERLRSEFVWAVGQHDNGWWEWDALAEQDPISGFPKGLREVLKNQQDGMQRWRLGLNRFEGKHFAKLMISLHAYWLYAARLEDNQNQDFNHTLFWKTDPETLMQGSEGPVQSFVLELKKTTSGVAG